MPDPVATFLEHYGREPDAFPSFPDLRNLSEDPSADAVEGAKMLASLVQGVMLHIDLQLHSPMGAFIEAPLAELPMEDQRRLAQVVLPILRKAARDAAIKALRDQIPGG